jgi:hypothetical protein
MNMMPWLLLLVPLPGVIALFKAEQYTDDETRAASVLSNEVCVAAALYIAHILGAF